MEALRDGATQQTLWPHEDKGSQRQSTDYLRLCNVSLGSFLLVLGCIRCLFGKSFSAKTFTAGKFLAGTCFWSCPITKGVKVEMGLKATRQQTLILRHISQVNLLERG